jgi:protein-L-isoaspartate(D-aspartate) O-methyltransferase
VTDERVLAAIAATPQAAFARPGYSWAFYNGRPVTIPDGLVTTDPSLAAVMIAGLRLTGSERVLEIGTGYGYQTALLARLAGQVISVEFYPDIAARARKNLIRRGVTNVRVLAGDGTKGYPEAAPYDAVLVSAAYPEVPPPLIAQLREGGRLVQPIGPGGNEQVTLFERSAGVLQRLRVLTQANFVRLRGQYGFARPSGGPKDE